MYGWMDDQSNEDVIGTSVYYVGNQLRQWAQRMMIVW